MNILNNLNYKEQYAILYAQVESLRDVVENCNVDVQSEDFDSLKREIKTFKKAIKRDRRIDHHECKSLKGRLSQMKHSLESTKKIAKAMRKEHFKASHTPETSQSTTLPLHDGSLTEEEPLECPITLCEIGTPAKTPCGHTFEAEAIKDWLNNHDTCPSCTQEVKEEDLQIHE